MKEAIFKSKFAEQVVVLESAEFEGSKGRRIKFDGGNYGTDDVEEIKALIAKTKRNTPGCKIFLADIPEWYWEEQAKEYHNGGGNYEIRGRKIKGKEEVIEILKEKEL